MPNLDLEEVKPGTLLITARYIDFVLSVEPAYSSFNYSYVITSTISLGRWRDGVDEVTIDSMHFIPGQYDTISY